MNELRAEISMWRFLDNWTGCAPWRDEKHLQVVLASDATPYKWGSFLVHQGKTKEFGDFWIQGQNSEEAIHVKEAFALLNTLKSVQSQLMDHRVDAFCDNMAVVKAWENQGGYRLRQIQNKKQLSAPMDSCWFRNILNLIVFSSVSVKKHDKPVEDYSAEKPCSMLLPIDNKLRDVHLVLTQEIIYRTVGSTVELVCPIVSSRDITWLGPPNYQEYAVGTEIFPEVSNQVAVSETAADKKSILLIHHFSKDNSGDYKCTDGIDKKEFNLINKRNPSNLVISNKIDDKTTTVEGKEYNLECRVTSGQPGGNITWSTDGVVVARNEPSFVSHRLTPKRSDNGKIFKCEAFNSDGEKILESSVRIEVFYIPKITFSPSQTITVKEGEETQLICINDGNDPDTTTVWKIQRTKTITSKNDQLKFKNVNRTDAGLYVCMVQTKAGVYKENANVVVQYAPTIDIQYVPTERKMECIPSGVPDRYVYKDWEHTTEYNDHIRFLPITKEGNNAILTIPKHETGKDHQRDRGLYICQASNNISSTDGIFVMKKYNLNFKGKPYFVSSTENIQFGAYLQTAKIKIKFVSVPEYKSYDVYKNESRSTDFTESVYRDIKLTDNIYGKNVSVKGSIISLQIQINTLDDFSSYNIVVKNAIGSSHHTIKLVSASAPFMPRFLQIAAKQTQIFVFWIPGFNGGFPQWFIVEYKEIVDFYWKNQTTRSSNSTVICGLNPATKYIIRMFARNMIDDSNRTEDFIIQTGNVVML
ncbi:Hypothetical predicted protein [Mytilus galloprovincialis]|uniref:Uncharacterized protein n=1 Tax=Mytilus galloprovincialis TaxID=29158 RepID=A0A8B6BGJ2_MYTGA|nr:Hypothetical predicted protein [Mytilus galloprovincialis]